jgi:hypothetical protein
MYFRGSPFIQTTLFEVFLFGFIRAAAWEFVCYFVVPKYVDVVTMYTPLTVGSSHCLCSSVIYCSVYVRK